MAPQVNKICCNGCTQEITDKQFLVCNNCHKHYDLLCINVSEKRFYNMSTDSKKNWKCQECKNKEPKTDNTNTPIKHGSLQSSNNNNEESNRANVTFRRTQDKQKTIATTVPTSTISTLTDQQPNELTSELKLLRQDIKEMRNDMLEFKSTLANLLVAINACNQRIDRLESRIDVVESRYEGKTAENISFLESTISDLKMELNDRDQDLLRNDIEIAGVPEEKNETTLHLVHAVVAKLGVTIEERDIVSAERVGAVRRELGVSGRPRPIVVQLARRTLRDNLLSEARVRRGINTNGLGLASAVCPLYINERLTKHNRHIFYKARTEAKRTNWKHVWTRGGKVFARKENGCPLHRLRIESDLLKVFGQ